MNVKKTSAVKVKENELAQLVKFGFKEHNRNESFFYYLEGKEVFDGHFKFKMQVVKFLTKKGVEFSVDTNDGFVIVKTFNELLAFLESEKLEEAHGKETR